MFRLVLPVFRRGASFPRVRGDVPQLVQNVFLIEPFSPRARGCSVLAWLGVEAVGVFPACAGMFPVCHSMGLTSLRFPRVRGDVPPGCRAVGYRLLFSPRARGCSHLAPGCIRVRCVFPACAGMFLRLPAWSRYISSFPRVRGDVPHPTHRRPPKHTFSPRARGCSGAGVGFRHSGIVFPACAGMFRFHRAKYQV